MSLRLYIICFLFLFAPHGVALGAETSGGTLSGKVIASEAGQRLPFVNIVLSGTKLGTTADANGVFKIEGVPEGTYTVIARLLGYADAEVPDIVLKIGQTTTVVVTMQERAIPLEGVQITADRARRLEDIRSSLLSVAPFRAKTLAGVGEDVMRTLQALPGVLSPNDFTSQLIVRGSGPDQNLIVMDDIEVFNPYRLYGVISMFNPETAADINLITGGFPAKYGDRLSAVLDVTNKEGDKTAGARGSVNASITNANVVLEGRSPFGMEGSYLFSARRTYYDLILGPIAKNSGLVSGDVAFPNFGDFQYKVTLEPGGGHRILANGVFSRDGVSIVTGPKRESPDSVSVVDDTRNDIVGLAWHYYPSDRFFSKLVLSWYRTRGISEFGGDILDPSLNREYFKSSGDTSGARYFNVEFDSQYEFRKVSLKNETGWLLDDHAVEIGAGIDFLTTSILWHLRPDETFRSFMRSRNISWVEDFVQSKDYERLNLYIQDRIKVGQKLNIQPGIRLDYYAIIDKAYLEPRINVSYRLDPITTLRGAWGVYRQSPGYEKLFDQRAFFDLTGASTSHLGAEQATHYVLGIDRWIDNRWQLRFETYYKKFNALIVQAYYPGTIYEVVPIAGGDPKKPSGWTQPVATTGDSLTTIPINGADGSAYGVEILLEKRNVGSDDRLAGWIGYSLAKAERVRDGVTRPFRFDQRHTVNVVVDYRLASWLDLGVRWKYGTNFPFTPPVGIKPRVVSETQNGVEVKTLQTDAKGNVIFDIDRGGEANRLSGRLPAYHRLDLRLTAYADFWDLDWSFYLDIINVYNRSNLLAYNYYLKEDLTIGQGDVTMFPILPTLGFSVRF